MLPQLIVGACLTAGAGSIHSPQQNDCAISLMRAPRLTSSCLFFLDMRTCCLPTVNRVYWCVVIRRRRVRRRNRRRTSSHEDHSDPITIDLVRLSHCLREMMT